MPLLCTKKIPISSQKQPQRAASEQTVFLSPALFFSLSMLAAAVVVVAVPFSLH